ncbi:hypothetical protein [Micromonospora sp. Llam0]|nr:hypothetical protein [Micromonospora sp. Llam0]
MLRSSPDPEVRRSHLLQVSSPLAPHEVAILAGPGGPAQHA